MFKKARFKLTAWYLLIIMTISILFSIAVYRGLTWEISRGLRIQANRLLPHDRIEAPFPVFPDPRSIDFDINVFEEARKRVVTRLILVNLGVLFFSGFASYFLAGKTLKPIEEMVEEQKRFTADASHELRTPLTTIKTEIEVALRDKKLDLKEARQLLDSNLEEVDKMQSLSDYLLTLNLYQNAKQRDNFKKVELTEIIKKAIEKVRALADKDQITVLQEGNKINLFADPVSLSHLITILLDNAIKYSPRGKKIIVKLQEEHKTAKIIVQDFGIGIETSDLPFIFNRFYRADTSRSKTRVNGYGLGLAIAKSIVELHHGKITVESTVGEGTTFIVNLPLKQDRAIL